MDEITQKIVILLLGFLGNALLLGVGYVIARKTVNDYQKSRDKSQIRENLLKDVKKLFLLFNRLRVFSKEYNSILKLKKENQKLEDKILNRKLELHRKIDLELAEYMATKALLYSKIIYQLILEKDDREIIIESGKKLGANMGKYFNEIILKDLIPSKKEKEKIEELIESINTINHLILTGNIKT